MSDFEEAGGLRWSETNGKIAAAFVAAQAEFGDVKKDKTAKITSTKGAYAYTYADLGTALDAVVPALNKHKLAALQPVSTTESGWIAVHTTLLHESGEWMASTLRMKPTNTDPQSAGSAVTYARRYSLLAMCGLAAEDDDGKHASRPRESQPEPARPAPAPVVKPDPRNLDAPGSITEASSKKLHEWLGLLSADEDFTLSAEMKLWTEATNGRVEEPTLGLLSENEGRRLGKLLKPRVEAAARAVEIDRNPAMAEEDGLLPL